MNSLLFVTIIALMLSITIIIFIKKYYDKEINKKEDYIDTLRLNINLLNHWVYIKQKKKKLSSYLLDKGYKNIAVYGMDKVGNLIINELHNSDINVIYGIDGQAGYTSSDIMTYTLEDDLIEVDAIIISYLPESEDIMKDIIKKLSCPIIYIEDIVYNL